MDFPHLQDTRFPYLDRENAYAFQNTFDYTRWTEGTRIRLVNVLWDSTYNDVVDFENDAARDAWFDAQDGDSITLETAARIVPEGFAKIPLPYDVATKYNYLYIEMPIATSAEKPIDYETSDGLRRWYFFIDAIEYASPNCTHVFLTPDAWINFHDRINIRYMMLERGHAPVAASDTDRYLANPMDNSEYLLAPDVDFGRGSLVRRAGFVPFGSGDKWVVFATECNYRDLLVMGQRTGNGSGAWTGATFSDSEARDGHDMNIHGYKWGNGYDYSNLQTRVSNGNETLGRIANNITCWAVHATECFNDYETSFIVRMTEECPAFMQTIRAMFVVDESMLRFGNETVELCGHELCYCVGSESNVRNIPLDRSMFDIPERYQRFAKLYTFPYSRLELTDNDGQTIEVRVEETGVLGYQLLTSLAFPFLDMRVLFHGIAGKGSSSYEWVSLNGESQQISIGSDDWGRVRFDWAIPTYALYMDGETAYWLRKDGDLLNARIDAVTGYHASMREANCAKNNAGALADTAKANADANADTLVANTANTCNAQTANTALTVATNTANVTEGNSAASDLLLYENDSIRRKKINDNTLMVATTNTNNQVTTSTTSNTAFSNIISGGVGGINGSLGASALAAANPGAAAALIGVSGVLGAAQAGVGAYFEVENAKVITQASQTVTDATVNTNDSNTSITTSSNQLNTDRLNDSRIAQNNNSNNCLTQQTANTVNAATANASNTSSTTKANASRTQGTSKSNAGYTQIAAERTAKEILEAAQRKARNKLECARNELPQPYGEVSGNPASDYFRTRGFQWKVRTQTDSAIAQAGDYFARYGYALNRMWDVQESGFCPMEHFCFWKATDIWVDCSNSTGSHADKTITSMFLNGVTVWKNPDEIGRVSVYDN